MAGREVLTLAGIKEISISLGKTPAERNTGIAFLLTFLISTARNPLLQAY
jgi:hypothetical protein